MNLRFLVLFGFLCSLAACGADDRVAASPVVALLGAEAPGGLHPQLLSCDEDDLKGAPDYGYLDVGPGVSMVPLCSGNILIGDRNTNEVRAINVFTGQTLATFALNAAPRKLVFDEHRRALYVTTDGSFMTRINLVNGRMTDIALPAAAQDLTLGNRDRLFASVGSYYWTPVAVIDGKHGIVEAVITPGFSGAGALLAYDRKTDQLIAGTASLSPASLTRYAFDANQLTLTQTQYLWNAGSTGQELTLSPDGRHIAYACGAGNSVPPAYSIADYSSDDLTVNFGSWAVGPYPRSARFSLDGDLLVASNGWNVMVFDAQEHVLLHSVTLNFQGCSYPGNPRVGISRGGRIAFARHTCGISGNSGRLHWSIIP